MSLAWISSEISKMLLKIILRNLDNAIIDYHAGISNLYWGICSLWMGANSQKVMQHSSHGIAICKVNAMFRWTRRLNKYHVNSSHINMESPSECMVSSWDLYHTQIIPSTTTSHITNPSVSNVTSPRKALHLVIC